MATGERVDPFRGYNFRIEIDGMGDEVAGFREVSGLSFTVDPMEYREGNDPNNHMRKLTGMPKYGNIVFKGGLTRNRDLYNWYRDVTNGVILRRNGAVILKDEQRLDVLRWEFFEGWPCKWEGGPFNATTNEVAVLSLEICVEQVQQV